MWNFKQEVLWRKENFVWQSLRDALGVFLYIKRASRPLSISQLEYLH